MSTMLKSAAMTLLSKTLQTFLSKYLSDVDVEGVALPSVYDGSGWGVRLSNVKLREGVQLMEQMPGKELKKRKRNKKKQKTKEPKEALEPNPQLPQNSYYTDDHDFPEELHVPRRAPSQNYNDYTDGSLQLNEVDHFRPSRSRTNSYDDLEVPIHDNGEQIDPPPRPGTPLQDSKSIFSCFTKGRSKTNPTTATKDDDDDTRLTTEEFSVSERKDDNGSSKPPVPLVSETSMYRQISELNIDDSRHLDFEGSVRTNPTTASERNEANDQDDDYEEYEQSYQLCLGQSGSIGTLDIRLVDKELHILVEDAVLTVEAFPIPQPTDETDGGPEVPQQVPSTTDDGASSTAGGAASTTSAPVPPKPKPKVPKAEPKRDTVGDRVLADNPLARLVASIPRLFLRDIRIRFIVHKEPKGTRSDNNESANGPTSEPVLGPGDTMLEVGIEFLSVSGGDDVLSHFQDRPEDEGRQPDDPTTGYSPSPSLSNVGTVTTAGTLVDNNDYIIRHIRTGRGPNAGIWVQVFAPTSPLPVHAVRGEIAWARQQWESVTNFHLLRCSGLDIRARIHIGAKKQAATYSWFYDYDEDSTAEQDYYDDFTLDTMFVGFDAIAPGAHLPLPPINPDTMSRGDTPVKASDSRYPVSSPTAESTVESLAPVPSASDKYTQDENGIQSCKVPSTFHRVSRGLLPGSCKDCTHLPSENCSKCWEAKRGVEQETPFDDSTPMPGLTLQISFRDPLEINIDRSTVDTIHLLKTLWVKKRQDNTERDADTPEVDAKKDKITASRASSTIEDSTRSSSSFFGFLSSKTKEVEKEKSPTDSFSLLMQPENIQVVGILLTQVVVRVHVMKEGGMIDNGLSFCYWNLIASCLTLDHQSLKSKEKLSHDLKCDIGHFSLDEYRGVECNRLVSLGLQPDIPEEQDSPDVVPDTKCSADERVTDETPWPSAACVLMNIPPPHETLRYKDRRWHGLQMRFISVKDPENLTDLARSMINLRLGVSMASLPWGFWRVINETRKEITQGILGKAKGLPPAPKTNEQPLPQQKSIMTYSVQIDGGSLTMDPIIDAKMPMTRFAGERSSDAGISVETLFEKLKIAYGIKANPKNQILSLQQLSLLPENVRSRILLFLDDLNPLAQALDIKREKNPFKRTLAVNRGILKMAKRLSKATRSTGRVSNELRSRRVEIMTEIMKLDEQELQELWAVHQRQLKKAAKKKAGSNL